MKYTISIITVILFSTSIYAKGRPMPRCPKQDNKLLLCHVPPGNPDNAKEITVNKDSLESHLGHGDYVGYCKNTVYAEKKELCGICDVDIDPSCT